MVLPVIADTIRVAVEGISSNGHHWANILHFRKTGALTYAGAIVILDPKLLSHYTVVAGGGTTWRQHAPTTTTLQAFRFTPLDGSTATTVNSHVLAGLSAGEPLPASNSLVVTLRTANRGRSYRGRVFQGPINEAVNVPPGVPAAADVSGVATQWTQFLVSLAGSGVSLVVASYKLGVATDVATCTVDSRWDTQRRRLNT